MTYNQERDVFIVRASKEGLSLDMIKRLLRHATTLQRLAVAQCNGDWPADNGERRVTPCSRCEQQWVPTTLVKGICKDCRTVQLVTALLSDTPFKPVFQGDPRGAVLQLAPKVATDEDIDCGRARGVFHVPARCR